MMRKFKEFYKEKNINEVDVVQPVQTAELQKKQMELNKQKTDLFNNAITSLNNLASITGDNPQLLSGLKKTLADLQTHQKTAQQKPGLI